MHAKVLVVEDEPMVAEVVARYLRRDGYAVEVVHDGLSAIERFEAERPDLIVLDIMIPRIDGLDVCRRVREQSETPIILLTARSSEPDKIHGLGLGADDYVTKPFSPRELVARVDAVLRRTRRSDAGGSESAELRVGEITIDPTTRRVDVGGRTVGLTAREFDLMLYLASHPAQVFTREQLTEGVWTQDFDGDLNTVTVTVRRLRAKTERDASRPRHLKTVWGVGYKLEP